MSVEQVGGGNPTDALKTAQDLDIRRDVGVSHTEDGLPVENKTILVDGPLSHVFTKGLNQVLAQESTVMQAVAIQEAQDAQGEVPKGKPYVYVYDARDDVTQARQHFDAVMAALKSGQYSEVRVVADASQGFSEHIDLTTEALGQAGAQVSVTGKMDRVFGLYGK